MEQRPVAWSGSPHNLQVPNAFHVVKESCSCYCGLKVVVDGRFVDTGQRLRDVSSKDKFERKLVSSSGECYFCTPCRRRFPAAIDDFYCFVRRKARAPTNPALGQKCYAMVSWSV